jgi:nucleoid DNA-binding protein
MSSKDQLAEIIAEATGCTKTAARDAVEGVFDTIMDNCKRAGEIQIPGFGKFRSKPASRSASSRPPPSRARSNRPLTEKGV